MTWCSPDSLGAPVCCFPGGVIAASLILICEDVVRLAPKIQRDPKRSKEIQRDPKRSKEIQRDISAETKSNTFCQLRILKHFDTMSVFSLSRNAWHGKLLQFDLTLCSRTSKKMKKKHGVEYTLLLDLDCYWDDGIHFTGQVWSWQSLVQQLELLGITALVRVLGQDLFTSAFATRR